MVDKTSAEGDVFDFLKSLGPTTDEERKRLEEAVREYSRKMEECESFWENYRKLSEKLGSDPELAGTVVKEGERWFEDVAGDYELYVFVLEKLGDLKEKSAPVARKAAANLDTILSHLSQRYDMKNFLGFFNRKNFAGLIGGFLDGIGMLAESNEKAAEFALDYAYRWPLNTRANEVWRGYICPPGQSLCGDYLRLMKILKEVAESQKRKAWEGLIKNTEDMLKELEGDVRRYFEKVKGEFGINGKYLEGPMDWLEYDGEYLGRFTVSDSHIGEEYAEKFNRSFGNAVHYLKRYWYFGRNSPGCTNPKPVEGALKALIDFGSDLARDIRGYRAGSSKPGKLEEIHQKIEEFSAMVNNYRENFCI